MMKTDKGCCGLKSLEIDEGFFSQSLSCLSPLLSSGACEALEELKLGSSYPKDRAVEELLEWLSRTKAPHLRVLILPYYATTRIATALCSMDGVAPLLQVLYMNDNDAALTSLLLQALGRGAWPHLKELNIRMWRRMNEIVPGVCLSTLVEAIGVGARELVSLTLSIRDFGGTEAAMALAGVLRDGGCPRLEELDLSYSEMGDGAVVELARALEGGAPCNTTLRRLCFQGCGITSVGMRELMESMGRGALPHLEYLDLSYNKDSLEEGGAVVAIAEALSGGALGSLQGLELLSVGMGESGARALFQAFRDLQPFPHHLKKLAIGGEDRIGDGGVMELARAIEAEALQHLQELRLTQVGMGEESFRSLIRAIVAQHPTPGCPRLEVLDVSNNRGIGDGGVVYLAEMMKVKGAMQHLQLINLERVGIDEEGERIFLEVIGESSGVCPNLGEVVGLTPTETIYGRIIQLNARSRVTRRGLTHCKFE